MACFGVCSLHPLDTIAPPALFRRKKAGNSPQLRLKHHVPPSSFCSASLRVKTELQAASSRIDMTQEFSTQRNCCAKIVMLTKRGGFVECVNSRERAGEQIVNRLGIPSWTTSLFVCNAPNEGVKIIREGVCK
jgi:hypothetical protein